MTKSCSIQEDIGIGGVLSLLWFQRRYVVREGHYSVANCCESERLDCKRGWVARGWSCERERVEL